MTREITIAGRKIGPGHPPFVIAEMSGNHNGDIKRALALVEAAKEAGADAVKLQTYTADTITIDHGGKDFAISGGLWDGRRLYELYQEAHTPWEWHSELFARGRELGLIVLSTPFDETAVDYLAELDSPAFKIASFEAIDLPLIEHAASKRKPLIISTGMADLGEITEAVEAARKGGTDQVALLHCVSAYPAPVEDTNLATIRHMSDAFDVVAGLSDHSLGIAVSVAAVALGASIIEKHFTLARSDGGPDSAFSLEPSEFRELTAACRVAWQAIGEVSYRRESSEEGSLQFRPSLYVVADMAAGEPFTSTNVRSIRPGYGLAPKHLAAVLQRKARRVLPRGTALSWQDID